MSPKDYKGIVVDTNLFLVYLVGCVDSRLLSKFKRTNSYDDQSFESLVSALNNFTTIATTPHVLTEVTDLLDTFNQQYDNVFFVLLEKLLGTIEEKIEPSIKLIQDNPQCFYKFGLCDLALAALAQDNYLVLTDDFKLYGYLASQSLPAINFNHIRFGYLG